MGDVFISYSRRDKDFVARLHDALARIGRSVWVDWEGIPPSAEWMKEIHGAIESADAVLFVVSSHSATSQVCSQEVLHAVGNNKRLIPVVREDINPSLLPQPVADRNWIFFRDSDDFDQALALLIKAIDVDLDWAKRHTRLLTRAVEWQNHDRDYAYALRGSDLRESERDLAHGESKDPRLTGLQIQYILESRRDTNRRRNMALGIAGITAAVLVVVGLSFWQKRHESNLNLARNIREKGTEELVNGNPLSAEVLFARSLTIDDALTTRELLLQARSKAAKLLRVTPPPANGKVLAVSPDGARYLVQSGSNLELRELSSRLLLQSFPVGPDRIAATAFSRDMRMLAVGTETSIALWALGSAASAPMRTIQSLPGLFSVGIGVDDAFIVAGSKDGVIAVTDLSAPPQPPMLIKAHTNRVSSFAFTPDRQSMVSGSWDNTAKVWSIVGGPGQQRTLKEQHTLVAHDDAVLSVALSADGSTAATGSWDNRIWLWDVGTGQRLRQLRGHAGGIVSLAFSANGNWLASGSEDRTARIWTVETGRVLIALPGLEGDVTSIAFAGAPSDPQLAGADENGAIRMWDLGAIGEREEVKTLRGHTRPINAIMFNPQQDQLASGSWDRSVRLWDLQTRQQRILGSPQDAHVDSVTVVAYSPDGRMLVSGGKDGAVRVWDMASGASHVLDRGEGAVPAALRDIAFSPDGTLIATANDDGRVRIWNAVDQKLVQDFPLVAGRTTEKVLGVAFSPDGTMLATGAEDGGIMTWRVADWSLLHTLHGHGKEVWQVVFSPDGKFLYSASDDRTVRAWDAATGQQLGAPLNHDGPVWSLDVSPDGKRLLTGSSDSTAHLWDIESRGGSIGIVHRFTLRLSDEPIWKVAFSRKPGSALLAAVTGADGDIRVLDVNRFESLFNDPQKLAQQSFEETGLQLTPGEELRVAATPSAASK